MGRINAINRANSLYKSLVTYISCSFLHLFGLGGPTKPWFVLGKVALCSNVLYNNGWWRGVAAANTAHHPFVQGFSFFGDFYCWLLYAPSSSMGFGTQYRFTVTADAFWLPSSVDGKTSRQNMGLAKTATTYLKWRFHWRSDDISTENISDCRNVVWPPVETAHGHIYLMWFQGPSSWAISCGCFRVAWIESFECIGRLRFLESRNSMTSLLQLILRLRALRNCFFRCTQP